MSHPSKEYPINKDFYSHCSLSDLGKIFDHAEYGEGFEGMARHISQMSTFERMDFEDLELCGDKLLAPHENIVDMPYYLTLEYLSKKIGGDLMLLEEYRDLLIDLEADKATCHEFEKWVNEKGIEPAIRYLKMLLIEMAVCNPGNEDYLTRMRDEENDSFDPMSWHKVGCLYEELEPLSWMDHQPRWYQQLIHTIDQAKDLDALSIMGKRLYQMNLTHDQASVAFDRYQICKSCLKSKIKLSPTARGLIGKINRANGNLGRLGAWLYKLQQGVIKMANLPTRHEWSIIWKAYRARKPGMSPSF